MRVRRRKFIQTAALVGVTVMSGFSLRADPRQRGIALSVVMHTGDGNYLFFIDGQQQILRITDEFGVLWVPEESCTLEYLAADGQTTMTVYLDQGTDESYLLPAMRMDDASEKWEVVLLGNPVSDGKIIGNISGPSNKSPVLQLTDIAGRPLSRKQIVKSKLAENFEMDISRFAKGTLLLTVTCDDFAHTIKVVHNN